MIRLIRWCGLAVCTVALAGIPVARSEQPGGSVPDAPPYTLESPPKDIADALRDLDGTDARKRRSAAAALAARDEAEPYLRHYLARRGRPEVEVAEAMEALEEARAKRNMKRVPEWAKAGRYDLLVDVSLHLNDTEQVNALGELLFDFGKAIRPIPKKWGGPESKHFLAHGMKFFAENTMMRYFHKKEGVLETDWITHAFVRAQSCKASSRTRFNWLVLTRNELKGTAQISNQWENCYIFHNSDVVFDSCVWSLVVCDGDVNFVHAVDGHCSTIIANGSIRSERWLHNGVSAYYAGGDIIAKGSTASDGLLLAGGKIDVTKAKNNAAGDGRVHKEGVKENPFGVRFFATEDVGVEATLKGDALTVTKLTPGSPLTKYGVKEGDVMTRVNEKTIKTLNDFRRELRYTVALEAGIFHITRGGEKLTRIVYFKSGLEK